MKLLISILILAISAQPLQAGSCDMDMAQDSSHHMEQTAASASDHDCCDSGEPEEQQDCDSGMHCGSCTGSVPAIFGTLKSPQVWANSYSRQISSGIVLPSHAAPPFRPPIS